VSLPPEAPTRSRRWNLLAALLAAGASLLLLWLPVYATTSASHSIGPNGVESSTSAGSGATLLEVNGVRALTPLLTPVALAGAPLLVPGGSTRRMATYVCAAALVVFVILAGFSIGMFYMPSAIAMVLAVAQQTRRHAAA
jgi:hypothetical protein